LEFSGTTPEFGGGNQAMFIFMIGYVFVSFLDCIFEIIREGIDEG